MRSKSGAYLEIVELRLVLLLVHIGFEFQIDDLLLRFTYIKVLKQFSKNE